MISISIALTTYNGELYINEQLDSFLRQTVMPDEVVISDDDSTDKTFSIINEFKENAPFKVLVLKNKKQGFSENFENALRHTTGDIIFISDQDDVWFDSKIEKTIDYFNKNKGKHLVIHDLDFCDSELKPIGQTKIERMRIMNKSIEDSYVTGMATAIKRDFLNTCIPFSKAIAYDTWIHRCAKLLNVKGVYYESLAFYRRHENNVTKSSLLNVPYKIEAYKKNNNIFESSSFSDLKKGEEFNMDLDRYLSCPNLELINNNLNLNRVKQDIYKRTQNYPYRIALLQENVLYRIPKSILFYLKNGYSSFSGLKSMFKDIILGMKKHI